MACPCNMFPEVSVLSITFFLTKMF